MTSTTLDLSTKVGAIHLWRPHAGRGRGQAMVYACRWDQLHVDVHTNN